MGSPAASLDLLKSLQRLRVWLVKPITHLGNVDEEWRRVFEDQAGDPTPTQVAPLKGTLEKWEEGEVPGLEPPWSFWPKFEHRFRPAEELWFAETLPAARRAGPLGTEAIAGFDTVLAARDALVAVLPADGRTPGTKIDGLNVFRPMHRLYEALDDFLGFVGPPSAPAGLGGRASRAWWKEIQQLQTEVSEWWTVGPHENLNY